MEMQFIDTNQSATAKALEIQQGIDEVAGFVEARLRRIYELVNTPGLEQAILNRMGTQGVAALGAYVAFSQAMEMVRPGSVPAADLEVFVAQEDGRLLFVEGEEGGS